jgi:PAS domain S-box-containing protein
MDASSKFTILIMDDEPLNLKLLSAFLEPDYNVLTAVTGQGTLDILEHENPDLIILDIMMPDIDGYEVCKRIRSVKRTQLTPIIMITALSRKEDRIKGIEAGADEFLSKPIDHLEVETRVKTLIEKSLLHKSIVQERNKSQRYLDISGCMMVALNANCKIELVNKKCCEILGYTEEDLLGQDWFELIVPEYLRVELKQSFAELISDSVKVYEELEYPILTKSGNERLINWKRSFVRDDDENIESALSSGNDITEERRIQNLLSKHSKDLEFSNSLKDLLFDVMKNDLLTPASSVTTFVDSLLEIEDNSYKEQMLHTIKKTVENIEEKIEEISKYTRMNSYKDLDTNEQNIADMLNDIIDFFGFEMLIKNIAIKTEYDGVYNAYLNDAVKDIFSNLISNSIMRSPVDSTVFINIRDNDHSWVVEFIDNGASHSVNEKEDVALDIFNEGDDAEFEGGDQAFSIIKRIIELYGGDIGITDNPAGQGLVFWIRLKKAGQ